MTPLKRLTRLTILATLVLNRNRIFAPAPSAVSCLSRASVHDSTLLSHPFCRFLPPPPAPCHPAPNRPTPPHASVRAKQYSGGWVSFHRGLTPGRAIVQAHLLPRRSFHAQPKHLDAQFQVHVWGRWGSSASGSRSQL